MIRAFLKFIFSTIGCMFYILFFVFIIMLVWFLLF